MNQPAVLASQPAAAGKPTWKDRFDSLFEPGPWLTISDVAAVTGMSDRHIAAACDSGELLCSRFGLGEKKRYRIARDDVIQFLARNADFGPDDLIEQIGRLVRRRSTREIELLREVLTAELKNRIQEALG